MIALKNVSKSYDDLPILEDISLRIDPGSCMCIIGESGSGKTTLARLLIRAEDPDSGSIEVDDVNIRTLPNPILQLYRRRVGVIFQETIVLDHLTVSENISLPLTLLGAPGALIERNTIDLLERLDLLSKAAMFPQSLSHSELSLLCIARALITAPMVLIADEPLHNLDAKQSAAVLELLANMSKRGNTVILFSRDADLGTALHAQNLQLKNGKIGKQAESERTASVPTDAHRILEEADKNMISTFEGVADVSKKNSSADAGQGSGKKIRITSIGSNS